MIIGKYNKSVIITYLGILLSLLGMYFSINENMTYAVICLMFAGICDLFDGKVARMCKRDEDEIEFGKQIDSLADVFSFLAFPAIIGLKLLKKEMFFILLIYILAGVIRLAWFHLKSNEEGSQSFYYGLPVTYMALILPIFYLLVELLQIHNLFLYEAVFLVAGILFILNIKIPKPKGIWYAIFSVMSLIVTVVLIRMI